MGKQNVPSDQTAPSETPTAYGAMSGGADRARDGAAGSALDRPNAVAGSVEEGGRPEPRANAGGTERSGNGNGNGHVGDTSGQNFDDHRVSGSDGARARSSAGAHVSTQSGGERRRQWRQSPQSARDVMTRNPKTVRPTDTVQQIAQLMVDEDTGIVPVVEGGKLVGVVTDRDIVCRLVANGTDLKGAKASDVMTAEVECVTEDDSLEDVLAVMGEHQIRRVGVVAKGDRLVGIISMADLAREADVDERLQDAFEEISAQRSFWSKMR